MRIPRFYIDQPLSIGLTLILPQTLHRHAIQVLRLKTAEKLILFNGKGGEYLAELTHVEKRRSELIVQYFNSISRESGLKTTLALAIIKSDKMDFSLQKAVEMGVNHLQPLYTQRSVIKIKANRLDKKMAHWSGIINAACEQSGRTRRPSLQSPLTLAAWLNLPTTAQRLAMLPQATVKLSALDAPKNNEVELIVGAEGGFTEQEVDLLRGSRVQGVQFGSRILRAETAVTAGLALCQAQWGDL